MTDRVPRLAITMGDPAGVGPEIIVKACRRLLPRIEAGGLRLLVIGHRSALHAAQTLLHETLEFASVEDAPLAFLAAGEEAEPIVFGSVAAALPTSRWRGRWNWRWRDGSMPSSPHR
jgi:4-hydroxythreonine-4-phosphate dehydrogenase